MYIGIDIGGTNTVIALVGDNCQVKGKVSVATFKDDGYQGLIRIISEKIRDIVSEYHYDLSDIKSIGVGCPGTPDIEQGVILYSCNLGFYNASIRTEIRKYFDLPVFIENDANCAALAESIVGATKDVRDSVTVTLGTGIGCGIIIDKKIYSGFNNAASEMGHCVIDVNGKLCTCGRTGCWETYASAIALKKQAIAAVQQNPHSLIKALVQNDVTKINGEVVFDAYQKGDTVAADIVRTYAKYVAEGLTNIVNILSPEIIAIGGGISGQGERFLSLIRGHVSNNVYCKTVKQTRIRVAQLGNDAGVIGAAMLCMQK